MTIPRRTSFPRHGVSTGARVAGLLLAAGGGRRLGGRPKALLTHRGRPLVAHAAAALRAGGCDPVHVVVGAAAPEVRAALTSSTEGCVAIGNHRWDEGMGTSLRAGLDSLRHTGGRVDAALVLLVDQPGVGAGAVARLVRAFAEAGAPRDALICAAYAGRRGHPVLLGARHWAGVVSAAVGDRGARDHLRAHEAEITLVECADIAEDFDVDMPDDLDRLG
jgi:CTP:molybdopterin cytidylyltransferase MocA